MPARRLSLTLLLVAPIISARRLSSEDLGLTGTTTAWGEQTENTENGDLYTSTSELGDWDTTTEPTETYQPEYDEGFENFGSWLRRKRSSDPEDDLETAEQVLFRPTFRYKHLVKEREKHRLQEQLRRQFSQKSQVSAQPSRKYYNTYPQQNQRYPQVPSAQRVYSQTSLSQSVYSPQRVYPQKTSPPQRVYSPQTAPPQRVYSTQSSPQRVYPQASATQKVYLANSPIVPNYPQLVQSSPQFPAQYTQGFRQQRSPYNYFYSPKTY
ncbi:adhesive plaque matrix protein-like [Macrosteles quadrilineatus]|uniref:adhesive plaque matrix protein-like n=1 Tax=Macrosteles quadrilineatus TaxID=74068 RepID=UPI0023E2DCB9|nr:adhesive plaque matrix protein-like [Macrosteles quadrilineatus]